ncbi:MAG: pyridoxal-dependent decarboxylase, exosortase A system-associated [Proteobacteria bacterium]|nr:pyridoxal-dependent decarboxylase, exosortase A system-associated [Pseudomonadota bacterium]
MQDAKPVHSRLQNVASADGQLLVNGVSVATLAERVGRTPFYAYDRAALSTRIAELRACLPARVKLHYAIKANSMPAVVAHLRPLVDGFDVASQREMLTALDSGMPASEVSFAGPAKQEWELRSAVAAGVCLNCESETEFDRIVRHADALGIAPRIALRVNPDFELKGAGMKMAGSPKQFGIDAARVPALLARMRATGMPVAGLHIFCGSQNLKAEAIIEANQRSLELALRLCAEAGVTLGFLNIGGGYGIAYFAGETPLDLAAVGAALDDSLRQHADALGDTEIVVELGRYIAGEAGYYVTRVTDIKESQGQTFVMVDGGLHHHLSNSGNFGQVIRKNYPVVIGNKLDAPHAQVVNIVGPLCTPLDIVADKLATPGMEIGDLVVVLQSGAYGYSASPHLFLSHPAPIEVLV